MLKKPLEDPLAQSQVTEAPMTPSAVPQGIPSLGPQPGMRPGALPRSVSRSAGHKTHPSR